MLSLVVAGVLGQLSATSDGGLTSAEVEDVFRYQGATLAGCGVDEPLELALRISPGGRASPLRPEEQRTDRARCFETVVGRWDFPIARGETTLTARWTRLPSFPMGPPRDAGVTQAQLDAVFATSGHDECFVEMVGLTQDWRAPVTLSVELAPSGVVLAARAQPHAVGIAQCVALHARTLRFPAAREGTLATVTLSRKSEKSVTRPGSGLDKPELKAVIDAHREEVRFCYEKLLQDRPTLSGKLLVKWVIGPDGSVLSAEVAKDELGEPAVAKCVVARVKRWVFGPPRGGGTVQVTFPWIFKRADE